MAGHESWEVGLSVPPLVSVITAVYNVAPYLAQSLESVLGQSFTDFEFICVDDGSTDGSFDILTGLLSR